MNKLLGGNFDLFIVVPHVSVIPNEKLLHLYNVNIYNIRKKVNNAPELLK